jgi:hypothetical protein
MKQNTGLIAALTVFLALFGISNLPKSAPTRGAQSETTNKSKSAAKPTSSKAHTLSPACEEIGSRLEPFLEKKSRQDETTNKQDGQHPGICYDGGKGPAGAHPSPLPPGVKFVIATVPNPISTHLPLVFDRMIEVIEQAAEDDKYSYDSSWFPWDEAKDYSSFTDQLLSQEAQKLKQAQPGVVVFRRAVNSEMIDDRVHSPYQSGLVVFVVAEQPTGGIDRQEFENALAWIEWLGGFSPERPLNVLGPSFSGSLPSLAQTLDSERLKRPAGVTQIHISVSSGSVSGQSSFFWFQNRLKDNHPGSSFQTAMEGDRLMMDRFLDYLDRQGYPISCVAVISEDETAFGAAEKEEVHNKENKDTHCEQEPSGRKHPIYLYYPRDIAMLRSAYERQSILNTGKQQSSGNFASTTLRGDLSEPNTSDHDTVRSYGGELTPLAQESVLLNITNILKEKQIQFVILRSTNSLDQIFLTQFLRRAYPAARIVIDGADLLFSRGAEGTSLRGVMTLSTYPLLSWQQDWTSSLLHRENGSYRSFGEDLGEGLYIAAREMFLDRELGSDVPVANYGPPAWATSGTGSAEGLRPATWLSVIGHHQFWPVAVLEKYPNGTGSELLPTATARHDTAFADDADVHPLRVPRELIVLLIACSVWSGLHCVWCWRGSIAPFPSLFRLAHFAPLESKQHQAFVAFGSFLPAAVAAVTAATSGVLDWSLIGWRGVVLTVWGVLIFVASCLACWANFRLGVSGKPSAIWRRSVGATAVVTFALFAWLHYGLVLKLTQENRIPAYWRSAHLLSGVSGLLPQLLLIAGMYLWFWFGLRGLALFGKDRPLLPKLDSLPVEGGQSLMPMFSRDKAAEPVEKEAIPASPHYLRWILPLTFLTTLVVFGLVLQDYALQTIGERLFGTMMFVWLSLCIAIILADTMQLWITWRKLRPLLVYLDRLPLRRTLASLRGLSWGSVWAVSGSTLEERYRVTSRQFESLRHLQNLLAERGKKKSASEDKAMATLETCTRKGHLFAKWYVEPDNRFNDTRPLQEVQEELAATAGSVMTNVLLPAWQRETDSLIFDRTQDDGKAEGKKEGGETGSPALADSVATYVLAAEEFFVLGYLGFIQNILGRIRTLILGCLFLFVAATLSVSSYPFDPLPVLGGMFLVLFLITGGTVVLVFGQMHRDATLSHITNTHPGELGGQFWVHLIIFGVGPLLGLLTTLFPSVTDFVTSWLQPSMQALQ